MSSYISEKLLSHHELGELDCGVSELNRWLLDHARHAQSMRTAQTFVWHCGDSRAVAYFSLAGHLTERAEVPGPLGRGSPRQIPSVLLARLALSQDLHGTGLGSELLWDALSRARYASEIAAARLVVVDAIDASAAEFYRHHGFVPVPEHPARLVQKMSTVAAALDAGALGSDMPTREEREGG